MHFCRHTAKTRNLKFGERGLLSSFFLFLVSPNDAKLPEIQNSSVAVTLCAEAGGAGQEIRCAVIFTLRAGPTPNWS
jgi:hypothetical protein